MNHYPCRGTWPTACMFALVASACLADATPLLAQERIVRENETRVQYESSFSTFSSRGFVPVYLKVYTQGGQQRFDTVFEKGPMVECILYYNMSSEDYQQKCADYRDVGYTRVCQNACLINGQVYWCALWHRPK